MLNLYSIKSTHHNNLQQLHKKRSKMQQLHKKRSQESTSISKFMDRLLNFLFGTCLLQLLTFHIFTRQQTSNMHWDQHFKKFII